MEIGCACVREPQNGECLGTAQVNGYLAFHVNAHGATELILKKKERKICCDPKCLTSLTCFTGGVTSPHCAPLLGIADLPVCL